MTNGTSALSLDEKTAGGLVPHPDPAARRGEWSFEQHLRIVEALKAYGCEYLNGREEYTLLKEIVTPDSVTEVTDSGKSRMARKPLNIRAEGSGVMVQEALPRSDGLTEGGQHRAGHSFLPGHSVRQHMP